MADFHQGDVIRDYLTLVDIDGIPINGSLWETIDTIDPDGDDFSLSVNEIGSGIYRVQFTAEKTGTYYYSISTSGLDPEQVFEETFIVDPVGAGGAIVGSAASGTTLLELIKMVAQTVGDFIEITATENGASDGTSFVDKLRLSAIPSQGLKGANLTVVRPVLSSNYLAQSRVKDSSESSRVLTLEPALPAQVTTGTVAWLTNIYSKGFWFNTYIDHINMAILSSYPGHVVPVEYVYPVAFSQDDPTIPKPQHLKKLWGVEYYDPGLGRYLSIPMAQGNVSWLPGWSYDYSIGSVVINGDWKYGIHGDTVRLMGYGKPAPLTDLDDLTDVDPEWIMYQCGRSLKWRMGDQRQLAPAAMYGNLADEVYRGKTITPTVPGTIDI